jgi:general secretion pathway protein H
MTTLKSHAKDQGFSLLEILVVLAIIAMAGAALTAINRPRQADVRQTASLVAGEALQARFDAISTNATRSIVLDLGARTLSDGSKNARSLPRDLSFAATVAESPVSAEGKAEIQFFPDGSSTGGEIVVSNGRVSFVIRVFWLTGTVTTGTI